MLKAHMNNSSGLLHVVLGNEACDLDSMVSAITFAYFLSKTVNSRTAVVPLLNIPRAEFPIRSDNVFLLRESSLSQEYLLFRDEVDLHSLQNLAITLVDHNILPEADRALEKAVVEVIDHHRLDRISSPSCPVTVEAVGSCTTLVTERIVQKSPELLDQQMAQLLYGTIIIDCVNMAPEAGKVTPKDSHYVSFLETRFPKLPPRNIFFQSLQNAKFDVSGLSTEQMMLKDMKTVSGGDLKLAISVIYMTLESFLQRHDLQQELSDFCQKYNLDLIVAMSISFIDSKEPYRQLAVYNSSSHSGHEVIKALKNARNPHLKLIPMSSPYKDVKAFIQDNNLASRKKVLPIITDYLKDREINVTNCGNLEDLELEEECKAELSDAQQCYEDNVLEEDSGVPPTPMNSLVEGCPLDNGLPKINTDVLVAKVSKIASQEEDEEQ